MPVLKPNESALRVSGALVLDLADLNRQAQEIVRRGRDDAERIVAAAHAEAKVLIDSADARGYADGVERGLAEGRARGLAQGREDALGEARPQLEMVHASWSGALDRFEAERREMLVGAREDVLRFAIALARKVVFRLAASDATVIGDQVAEALGLLVEPSALRIAIHPDDRPVLEEVLPRLLARFEGSTDARIEEDPAITRGGCIVRTSRGRIDARLETQLDRLAATLVPGGERTAAREADEGERS